MSNENTPELTIKNFEEERFVDETIDKVSAVTEKPFQPRNRAERRAMEKATRRQMQKRKRVYIDSIKEATKKLAYIDMIEKVRALNEKIQEEGVIENEATN